MKLLISIGIGLLFLMIGQLYLDDFFNIGKLNFLGVKDMGTADFSGIQTIAHKLLFIPDLINNFSSDYIKEILEKYIKVSENQVFLGITFSFYFIFSYSLALITGIFHFNNDKRNIIGLVLLTYLILLFLI